MRQVWRTPRCSTGESRTRHALLNCPRGRPAPVCGAEWTETLDVVAHIWAEVEATAVAPSQRGRGDRGCLWLVRGGHPVAQPGTALGLPDLGKTTMSAVLQRLVGRATGAVIGGLRPRVPSLFEAGSREAGLRETQVDAFESNISEPVPGPATTQDGPAPPAAVVSGDPSPQSTQPLSQPLYSASEPPIAPKPTIEPQLRDVSQPALPAAVAAAVPKPPTPESAPAQVGPEPLLPEADPARVAPILWPHVDPSPPGEDPTHAGAVTPTAAPAPLLRPEPRHRMAEAPTVALPRRHAARVGKTQPTVPNAPEQEIVVHIGRLDIRADPPKPARAPRAAQRPSLPALSDYLRGGRS